MHTRIKCIWVCKCNVNIYQALYFVRSECQWRKYIFVIFGCPHEMAHGIGGISAILFDLYKVCWLCFVLLHRRAVVTEVSIIRSPSVCKTARRTNAKFLGNVSINHISSPFLGVYPFFSFSLIWDHMEGKVSNAFSSENTQQIHP